MKLQSLLPLAATCGLLHADPAADLTKAAGNFLASLDETHRESAVIPFDDAERENWHYTPRDRRGLSLKAMDEPQKKAAMALVNAALSEKGAWKASHVVMLESVLAELENNPDFRDPEKYWLAIFGAPGDEHGWGFRCEGHHLSINVTLVDGTFSVTPNFMGANPARVPEGEHEGLRVLADEEDLARNLTLALLQADRDKAVFSTKPPGEIVTGEERVADRPPEVGIPAESMTDTQREALFEIIKLYTHRFHPEIAESELKAIREHGDIHFGWAGGTDPGDAFYYRIQGPEFLIETANTQNDANHIHTVWREFDGDFGRDLLREHMEDHEH